MPDHLTPPERETVILTSDADGTWTLSTHQRKVLTRLKNAGWEPVEDLSYGRQPGRRFELPFGAVTIRPRASVERVPSDEQRTAASERMRRVREAQGR